MSNCEPSLDSANVDSHGDNQDNATSGVTSSHGDDHDNATSGVTSSLGDKSQDNAASGVTSSHGGNQGNAANGVTSHHGDHHGNRLLRFVCGDDEEYPTLTTDSSFLLEMREEETEKSEEMENIRVAVKCEISTVHSRFGIKALTELIDRTNKRMINESIQRLEEFNSELGEAYSRLVSSLKTHYEEKISLYEQKLMQRKQEMDDAQQRYEQNLSEDDINQTTKELDEAKKLLEKARDEERLAKRNLERVLQDNYLREEEILRLNRLLVHQKEKDELEIWTTKERFDECLVQTLQKRDAEITEYKKKIDELELRITEGQVNGAKSLESIFQDDLEALQLERNALRQVNERYVHLISDYVRLSVFLEQRTNSQLSPSSSSSLTSSGIQLSSVSGQTNKRQLSDASADERASSVASTADEGLDVSPLSSNGLFPGSDFDAECDEAAKEASFSIQRSFDLLLDAVIHSINHSDETQKKLKDTLQSTENTNKDLMEVCEEFQEKLMKESSTVARLTEQLHVREEELELIKKARNERNEEPKKRDEENELISSLYHTVEDLEHKLNETKKREADIQKRNQELEQIIRDFEEVRDDKESMQTKFYEQLILISSLKSQLDEQKLMTNEYIKDAKNVSRWKEIMEEEKESSKAKDGKLNDLKKEVTDLEQLIINNHVEINKFRTEIEICKKQRIDMELQLTESHKREVSELGGALKEKETVIQNLTTQLQSKQNELETLTDANSQLMRHYETETNRFREHLEEKRILVEIQIDEMSSLQSQLDRKDVKISQLTDELDSSEEDLAKLRRSFETKRKEFVESTTKMEEKVLSLTDQLNEEKGINMEQTSQMERMERELDGRKRKMEELRTESQDQLRRIDELEACVDKLRTKLDDSESEIERTKEMLEDIQMQMKVQLQKMEEMKRHHKKEIQDLLEDKEKEMESLHNAEINDARRSNEAKLEELRTHLLKVKEKEIEELEKLYEKDLKELELSHAKELEALLMEKEKAVEELKASHRKKLDDLRVEKKREVDVALSKHLDEMDEMEKSLESQQQHQLQKLREKHTEELSEMEDEIRSGHEAIDKLEKQLAECGRQREAEKAEVNARHAEELHELSESYKKEIRTMQSELSESYKSVEELKQRIARIEIDKSEEMRNLSDRHSRAVGELKLALETQNDERVQKVTEKREVVLNEMNGEVTKLRAVIAELKRSISEDENCREKERNEVEIRRTQELKDLRSTLERQNDEQLQVIFRKHKEAVCEIDDKVKKYQKEIEALKQTIAETERQRDRVIREAGLIQEEMARSEKAAKELEYRFRMELKEKVSEMNEANARHAQELEALRSSQQAENEEQFNILSEKYEQKFCGLREELEKRETEEKQPKKTEKIKHLWNDAAARKSRQPREVIGDMERQQKLNEDQRDIRELEEELQQEAVRKEKECGELISRHSGEILELTATHQRHLDEIADNYRVEMEDLRRELSRSRDLLKDLNAEHSKELAQLREELEHRNEAVHDNCPARYFSETVKLETKKPAVPSQEAWQLERQCLLAEIDVFKNLLKDIGNGDDSKDSESMDWRTDILKAIHDVLTRQVNRTTVSEIIYHPITSKVSNQELNTLLQGKVEELEQFYSQGLGQILAVDRKSMLDEIDDLREQIGSLQQELLNDNKDLTDKLNSLELRYKKRQKRLKNQLNAAETQLSEEREMRTELQSMADVERLYIEQLKDELNQERDSAEQLKRKISQLQKQLVGSEKEERFESEQTVIEPTHERFHKEHGYGQISDVIERLTLELLQEKEVHLQTKCDLAWERTQCENLENKIKSHWEKIGSLDADVQLELFPETYLHKENPVFRDDFYDSMRREELILLQCGQLQHLVAKYRDELSRCSILSRDTTILDQELRSIYQSLDSLVRYEDRMGDIGVNLSSRLLALSRRCVKAEEHLMALAYQKRYLLLLIGGFQDSEQDTLAAIARLDRLGVYSAPVTRIHRYRHPAPLNRFRRAVQTVLAVIRLQSLVRRWGSFRGDMPKQINSLSTWKTLSSGIGTGRENRSFSSIPSTSLDSSLQAVGEERFISNRQHRSRSPTARARATSRTTPRAFDDDVMSRSCDFGSETLSLVYSHYPRSPSRSSTKRRCLDGYDSIRRQRISKSPQSGDFMISRKLPVRPASTYLW